MPDEDGLIAYATDLQQSVAFEAELEGVEQMRSLVFTRQLIDVLIEAGEIEDGLPCHWRDRGIEVHGTRNRTRVGPAGSSTAAALRPIARRRGSA